VEIHEFERWAEPFDRGLSRTLAEDLALAMPERRVMLHPWSASDAVKHWVAVNVSESSRRSGGEVQLEAHWAILAQSDELPLARGRSQLSRSASGSSFAATVATMSELVGGLAEEIARELRELPVPVENDVPEEEP